MWRTNLPKKYYKQLPRDLRDALERYVRACDADSWKGGGDPESYPEIEKELKESKQLLTNKLHALVDDARRKIT